MVENRLNEERLIFVQEEIVKPMAIAVCDKQRVFETERKATNEAIAADATKSESERKVAQAIVVSASSKLEALSLINGDINRYFQTFIKPLNHPSRLHVNLRQITLRHCAYPHPYSHLHPHP